MKENYVGEKNSNDEKNEEVILEGAREFRRKINTFQNRERNQNSITIYKKKSRNNNLLSPNRIVQYSQKNDDNNKLCYVSLIKSTYKNRNKQEHQKNFNKMISFQNELKFQKYEENISHNINNLYNININRIKKISLNPSINKKRTFELNINKQNESERSLKNEGITINKNSDLKFITSKSYFYNNEIDIFPKKNKNISENNHNNNNTIINNLIVDKNNDKKFKLSEINNNIILQEKNSNNNRIDKNKIVESGINCYICEKMYYFSNIYFAKCKIHFFCKNCLRTYYHELIENGIRRMKCPIYKCIYDIDDIFLKKILDNHCYQILFNQKNEKEEKKTNIDDISISMPIMKLFKNKEISREKLYYKRSVIDVSSNLDLYFIRKSKDQYCPKCNEPSVFRKTNAFFYKCLNCGFKICKYCNKEFTDIHLIMNDYNHCKVFYRAKKKFISNNILFDFFIQMLYTFGMFLIFVVFCFYLINNIFWIIFGIHDKNINYIKSFFSLLLSILIYLIIIPILIIIIPFFPNIMALTDD